MGAVFSNPPTESEEPLLPTSQQDIDRLQPSKATASKVLAVIAALKTGKMPTEQQLENILQKVSNSDVLNSSAIGRTGRFSAEGQLVVEDIRAIIEDIIKLGQEKNGDDKFQRFIYQTQLASDIDFEIAQPETSVSRREARKDTRKAVESIRTLGNLLITSPEFRNIISEITFVSRDLFADAASQLADKAKDAAEAARPSEDERCEGVDIEKAKQVAKQKGAEVQKKYRTGRYEAEVTDAMASAREWADEQLPDNSRDEVIERLKKLVVSVQKNDDYHNSINTIVDLAKKYAKKSVDAAQEVKDKSTVEVDDDAEEALGLLKEIIESLANGKSLDGAMNAFNRVVEDIRGDDRLSAYFDDLTKYVNRLLHDEGWVFSQQANRRADELIDRAQELIEGNAAWKADYRNLVDELRAYQRAIEDDKTISQLTKHASYLKTDLHDFGIAGFNIFSSKALGLYKDLYDVVLPRVIDSIKQIPLPRIEYVSEELDLAIDSFVIESASFIPDRVELTNFNDLVLEQGYAAFASNFDSSTRLRVQGLRFKASDIAYYVNSKSGWGWEDAGLLAIDLSDGGINFDVKLALAGEDDKETFFKVDTVKVDIVNLQFSVSRSDHWVLNTIVKPFVKPYIHDALKRTLEQQIRKFLEDADHQLYGFQERAVAASTAAPSPAAYFRALFAPHRPFSKSPSASTTNTGMIITGARGEFRVAIGAEEQLLPGRGGPSADYERRKELIELAKSQTSRVLGSGRSITAQAAAGYGAAVDEVGKLGTDLKRKQRQEAAATGWQSAAFDV